MYQRRSILTGIAFLTGVVASQANQLVANATHSTPSVSGSTFDCSTIVVPKSYLKHIPAWLYHVDLSDAQLKQIIQINQQFKQSLADRKAVTKQAATTMRQSSQPLSSAVALQQKRDLHQAKRQVERLLDEKRLAIRAVLTPEQRLVAAQSVLSRRNHDHLLSVLMPDGGQLSIVQ